MMAFRKHITLAFALLALTAMLAGCADETVTSIEQNEAPVLAPTNVQADIINGRDVRISWDPSTQLNVRGYNVYRLDRESGSIGRLNPSVIAGASYTDGATAFGGEYEYRVTAVGAKNAESNYAVVVITIRNPVPNRKGQTPGTQE